MNEPVLSTEEAKRKLERLEDYLPDAPNKLVYSFGRHLAGYLHPEIVPMEFLMACEMALYNLESGVNGFTGEPVQMRSLLGHPTVVYALLRTELPRIAEAIFPADFAASVKSAIEAVDSSARESQ